MTAAKTKSLTLSQYMPYQLVNLAKRVSDDCSAVYTEPFAISIAEWRVLARLGESEELHSRGLGEITFMDKSRVSRAIAQLQDKRYLRRRPDPSDNRASYLALTKSGRQLYSKIVPRALEWEATFLSALDVAEYRDLLRIIAKLDAQLDSMADAE